MKLGALTIDAVIDGENPRELSYLYPDAPPAELAASGHFADLDTGQLVITLGSYLIRGEGRTILVDAGVGRAPTAPFVGGALRAGLLARGVHPSEITDVLFTHLHNDHIGWATQDGVPFFRNATYRCDRRDWEHFMAEDYDMPAWERGATNPDVDAATVRLAPLADRMEFWEGDDTILPGVTSLDAAGHTPGTTAIVLESEGQRGVLLGDIVHSVPELLYAWDFLIHVDHRRALESVKKLREFVAAEDVVCSASHLPGLAWGRVSRTGDSYAWTPAE